MSKRWFARSAVAAIGSAVMMSTAAADAAESPSPGCGTVIVESVTLTHNVTGCADDGLVIQADNVDLDLGGHTVRGTGVGSGIVIVGSNVRVSDGSVRGFEVGVSVEGGWKARLAGVELSNLKASENTRAGVTATYVTGATFTYNDLRHNGAWGLSAFELHGVVAENDIVANGRDSTSATDAGGINLKESGGVLSDNRARANSGPGIRLADPYALEVSRNLADSNAADGIVTSENYPGYDHVVVTANSANRNGGYGIRAEAQSWMDPPGLPTDGGGNSARHNGNPAQCLNIDCTTKRTQGEPPSESS